jgi:hypothetical protein
MLCVRRWYCPDANPRCAGFGLAFSTESPHPPWSIFANTHAREPGLSDREWLFHFHDVRRAAQPRHLVLAPEREPTASVRRPWRRDRHTRPQLGVASDGFWQDAVPLGYVVSVLGRQAKHAHRVSNSVDDSQAVGTAQQRVECFPLAVGVRRCLRVDVPELVDGGQRNLGLTTDSSQFVCHRIERAQRV